jgi:hypothetical protein
MSEDSYLPEVLKITPEPGTIKEVEVLHDDWCSFLASSGSDPCDCNPELIVSPPLTVSIDPNLPKLMRSDRIYRGKDGRWYHADGRIVPRAERRKAGVR